MFGPIWLSDLLAIAMIAYSGMKGRARFVAVTADDTPAPKPSW